MTDDATTSEKKPRFRSPPYPAVPLDKAVERAEEFYGKALHHPVPISVAAAAWGYGEKSSGLFATVAALKQFGLLMDEGAGGKRRFKLTDSALRIVRDPDPNSEKRSAAIKAAALAPKIHSELWEKYEAAGASGAMDVALKSRLTVDRADEGAAPYSNVAADEVISEYRQTMEFAGLIESGDVSSGSDDDEEIANLNEPEGDTAMHGHIQNERYGVNSEERRAPPPPPPGDPMSVAGSPSIVLYNDRLRINADVDLKEAKALMIKLQKRIALLEEEQGSEERQ